MSEADLCPSSTNEASPREALRALPAVDELLSLPVSQEAVERFSRPLVVAAIRQTIDRVRESILAGDAAIAVSWADRLAEAYASLERRLLTPVINATGVVLHTNLGRAPLARSAVQAVVRVAEGYSNLEYDVEEGKRGSRHTHGEHLLTQLTGAEAAMAVNNNAAAVLLLLAATAAGREVVVSRGELIEIGGSFRIPDVLRQSGCRLVEVGTTNRTHRRDYEAAVTEETAALLKVHTSNYKVTGFTQSVTSRELAPVAKAKGVYLLEDLGSGVLVKTERYGLVHEPTVQEAVAAGVDAVTFSGDKLLGGPQIGIIAGRRRIVEACRSHPLARAVRVDKMTLAALQATLLEYGRDPGEQIPIWRMMALTPEALRRRAERVRDAVAARLTQAEMSGAFAVSIRRGESAVGGGSLPGETLPTWLVALHSSSEADPDSRERSPESLAAVLRRGNPPLVGRIEHDAVLLDLRTVYPDDDETLAARVAQALLE